MSTPAASRSMLVGVITPAMPLRSWSKTSISSGLQ
jgi:hypothetical protein